MTYLQMYDIGQTLLDKAGSPYYPPDQWDIFANIVLDDLFQKEYDKLEKGEKQTSLMLWTYRGFQKVNSSFIDIYTDIPDWRYTIRINAKFRKDCNGTITYPVVNVIPFQNDDIDMAQNDPLNKGDDDEPTYIMTVNGTTPRLQVFSTTTPLEINLTYLKQPVAIDSANNPNTVAEFNDAFARYVVRMVDEMLKGNTENYPAAQAALNNLGTNTTIYQP